MVRVLNLYAGLGGNRKNWNTVMVDGEEKGIKVTAIENDPNIAERYKELYPEDRVIIGDAHDYLLRHCLEYDFIWSSFPCLSHTQFNLMRLSEEWIYPDLGLYQELIFLRTHFTGKYVVENVEPYYLPLIKAKRVSRHLFWSNFYIPDVSIEFPGSFKDAGEKQLSRWLGIECGPDLFKGDRIKRRQIMRNCVHPALGEHVLKYAFTPLQQELFNQ